MTRDTTPRKYEFTRETATCMGTVVHRIRALRDIPLYGIHAGELGGFIEAEENLSHEGDAWVDGDACVVAHAQIYGDARVMGKAVVSGHARVYGRARVSGYATVDDAVQVRQFAVVTGHAGVSGNADVFGSAYVSGHAVVSSDARISGDACVTDYVEVYGNATVGGKALVTGHAVIRGGAEVAGSEDYMVFKNSWSSMRHFTYTRSNGMWAVGCFHGTGPELISAAFRDSELSGRCYEAAVRMAEAVDSAQRA